MWRLKALLNGISLGFLIVLGGLTIFAIGNGIYKNLQESRDRIVLCRKVCLPHPMEFVGDKCACHTELEIKEGI